MDAPGLDRPYRPLADVEVAGDMLPMAGGVPDGQNLIHRQDAPAAHLGLTALPGFERLAGDVPGTDAQPIAARLHELLVARQEAFEKLPTEPLRVVRLAKGAEA